MTQHPENAACVHGTYSESKYAAAYSAAVHSRLSPEVSRVQSELQKLKEDSGRWFATCTSEEHIRKEAADICDAIDSRVDDFNHNASRIYVEEFYSYRNKITEGTEPRLRRREQGSVILLCLIAPVIGFASSWLLSIVVAVLVMANYKPWLLDHMLLSIAVPLLVLLLLGLRIGLPLVRAPFDRARSAVQARSPVAAHRLVNISSNLSATLWTPFDLPSIPHRSTISQSEVREHFESPGLSSVRGGLIGGSLGGALAGLIINVGLQAWEGLTAEQRHRKAQEQLDIKYAAELRDYEAAVSRISRISLADKKDAIKSSLLALLADANLQIGRLVSQSSAGAHGSDRLTMLEQDIEDALTFSIWKLDLNG